MADTKKVKTPDGRLKTAKIQRRVLIVFEALFIALILCGCIVMFVPSIRSGAVKAMTTSSFGQKIISLLGSEAYSNGMFDDSFDNGRLRTNNLDYNYSEEYTDFVMYGVDSRNGEVDASNSDSILIVSIHNTTGEVKMVSVYRDTFMGIYDADGNFTQYFKVNSAYSYGGPEGSINTLNMNLDLDIKNYVAVNFSGVAEIIDTLGGIEVNLTDDEVAQLNHHMKSTISSTGRTASLVTHSGENIKLNGIQATTYCRIRKATFYDPDTGEAISNDFGRAARQRLVITKLVDKARKASISELQQMVSTVLSDDSNDMIATSFSFDEIINMLPILFDFSLGGSVGFPSGLVTGTIDGVSYVIPTGLASNVSELHEYLYGEEDYQPTDTVISLSNYITGYTGISEYTDSSYNLGESEASESEETTEPYYDYDDGGNSEYY